METTVTKASKWQVVRLEQLNLTEREIEKHMRTLKALLDAGHRHIALSLAPSEFPFSKCLSLLIRCYKMVHLYHGQFVVIQSNEFFFKTIQATNLHKVIRFLSSEEAIAKID